MIKKWLRSIIRVGVSEELTKQQSMSVTLSNYISLLLIVISTILLFSSSEQNEIKTFPIVLLGLFLFIVPLLLNKVRFYKINELYISWVPPLYILFHLFYWLNYFDGLLSIENYIGIRFYFIALGCIPFIINNSRKLGWILLAALPTFTILLFLNNLLALYDIEYFNNLTEPAHFSNSTRRSILAYFFVAGSCYLLKYFVDSYLLTNQNLVEQLDAQNLFIQKQADVKLDQVNHQLKIKIEELNKREQMLKLSQQVAKIGSWEFGIKGFFTFWSEEMYNIFDIDTDTPLNEIDHKKLLGEDKWEGFSKVSSDLISKNGEFTLVFNIISTLGYSKWIKASAYSIIVNDKLVGVRGICHDITQAKESEMLLKASENKYRSLYEQSFYPILLLNPEGLILDANSSLTALTQKPKGQYLLKKLDTIIQFNEGKKYDFSENNYTEETLGEITSQEGEKLLVEVNWKVMSSERVVMTLRDVTQIKAGEKHLIESEERYKELVENATEALVLFNTNSKLFVNVSKSAEQLFRFPQETLLQMGFCDISPIVQPNGQESEEFISEIIKETLIYGKKSFNWICQDSEDNKIPVEIRLIKIQSKNGELIRGSIIDISDRIENAKELEIANKKIGELKLTALRSAMSPHFIFNVLNSIQYFIGKNERLNAINYLSTFSKLIRSILTHSVDNKIKLSEELDMLKNYISLEMLRFEEKFDFKLIIDPELEIDYIKIPSLLIQPYVENAILHGIYNKKEKGCLTIKIKEKGDVIYFTIEDDGIGRKAAMELNDKNFPGHKSLGLKLTEERLRLINENRKITFYIEDLQENGKASGTKVTIGILL